MDNLKIQETSNRKHEAPSNTVIYSELPDVLIQDSKNCVNYYINSRDLATLNFDTNISIPENTMTFLIPDEDYIGEVPFTQTYEKPSIIIQFPKGNSSYFISNESLQKFKITKFGELDKVSENCISFIIPVGDDFLEDIPNMSPAMLQAGCEMTEWPSPVK